MKRTFFVGAIVLIALSGFCQIKKAPTATNTVAAPEAAEPPPSKWQNVKTNAAQSWADIKQTLGASADYTFAKKDEFIAKAKADMKTLDARIKELTKKTSKANDGTKASAEKNLSKLRAQREELNKKLKAAKAATAEDWDKAKAGFTNGYAQVKESVKDAWQWVSDKVGN